MKTMRAWVLDVPGGGSAGGHVAAVAATVLEFEPDEEEHSISSKADALVLFNPVIDNGPGGAGHDRVKERWREFSPKHNIAAGVPPAIVFLGTEDYLIPVSTAEEFQRRMNEVGARCDLLTYGQPHAFFNHCDGSNPYYNATVCEADRFLASLGYLDGEPTLKTEAVEAICQ
jgi:acetyl esterase